MIKDFIKKFIPPFLLDFYHLGLAFLGAVIYRFPSRNLVVIGVTGTKGKSTVVDFCHRIFQAAGFKVASLSSIRFKINNKEKPNLLKMTMPGRFQIQKFFRQALNQGCQYMVLEVTSEGISQHRHEFIRFNAAVFTNLSAEHIERHGSFENYKKAKGKLFSVTKNIHIINVEDENAKYFLQFPARKKITYGLSQGDINNKNIKLQLQLPGEFNIYNALAAIGVGLSQGISLEICRKAIEKTAGIPGRMETVVEKPFKVIVDYAHIPDALEKVYQTLNNLTPEAYGLKPKLICVLGSAGGGRDKWKRPEMGKIAANYCDKIILTNEDPYDENPEEIISQIEAGIYKKEKVLKIIDREEAIKTAVSLVKEGEGVIFTGKGSESSIHLAGGKKIPWNEKEKVLEALKSL